MKTVVPVSELEKRMRPRAYSTEGFLGPSETLEVVLQQDEIALRDLGISFNQIAGELTRLLGTVLKQREKLSQLNFQEYYEREDHTVYWDQQPAPVFSLENLPTTKIGFIVENKYQVLFWQSKGLQDCPWGCKRSNTWSSFDFLLLNRETGEYITAPGLIAHLIKKHHFLKGEKVPIVLTQLNWHKFLILSDEKQNAPNTACTRRVGVCAFSSSLRGFKLVPSKRLLLVPPTRG